MSSNPTEATKKYEPRVHRALTFLCQIPAHDAILSRKFLAFSIPFIDPFKLLSLMGGPRCPIGVLSLAIRYVLS